MERGPSGRNGNYILLWYTHVVHDLANLVEIDTSHRHVVRCEKSDGTIKTSSLNDHLFNC